MAGHVQTNQTDVTENSLLTHFETDGEFFCLGKNIITNANNRSFSTDTGEWVGYNIADANVNVDDTTANKMYLTTTTDNEDEGALLPVSSMETLVVGKKYIISATIDHKGSGNITMRYDLGGATSSDITATTNNRYHRVEVTCTDASGPLRIYSVAETTARNIEIDNVYVYEKYGNTVDENAPSTPNDWTPRIYGTTVNTTGKICIFPGINRASIRDFKEQQVVTAELYGGTSNVDVTAKLHAVTFCVNKFGKLMAKRDELPSNASELYGQYGIQDNMWGLALESGSRGDIIKVLASGRISDTDTSADTLTWEPGDLVRQITTNGKKERQTGQKYSFINSDDDKTITGSPNWADYSPNTTIGGFNVNTSSGRVEITGSGNGFYNNTGGTGREGGILGKAYLRKMSTSTTSFSTNIYLPYRRTFLMKADVWSSGGTAPNICFAINQQTSASSLSFIPRDADGSHLVTTTQKTFYAFVVTTTGSTSGYDDYMTISQTNDTTDTWYFTNVELLNMPYSTTEHLAVCLNSDKKEWYIH